MFLFDSWKDDTWVGESKPPCTDPSHFGYSHIYIPPGSSVEHTCPRCGHKTVLTTPPICF
jgi:hypothetical protein